MPAVISPTVFESFVEDLSVALRISTGTNEVLAVYEDLPERSEVTVYVSVPNSQNVLVETIEPAQMEEYLSTITDVRDSSATVITDEFNVA